MKDLSNRFPQNPLLSPKNIKPYYEHFEIAGLLNPGVFRFQNKTWLIVRVAESPLQTSELISIPFLENNKIKIMEIRRDDTELISADPRLISYQGNDYLTTLSHLRLFCSDDGIHFHEPEDYPCLYGEGPHEKFGIEDCRVSLVEDTYYLTYTAVSQNGVGVGMRTTKDWKTFTKHGMILPPHNKDCCIFEEKINGKFYCLHRPSSPAIGGNYIWLASSPDGIHWGDHRCIARTRPGAWDSARIGAGATPVKTEKGWLEIYHGADEQHRYCLGALLLDLNDPSIFLGRTEEPIMEPVMNYETEGFFGNVVFTNGHVIDGDKLIVYYGASDELICGAVFSIEEILSKLV